MIYTFMHLKFAMTKEAIHLCTVQENDPNLTGKKYILIQQCILEKFLVSSFFISRNFLLAFLPFDNYLGEFLPVYKVGHVVVAHFCQLEDILDDKPANDNDDKRLVMMMLVRRIELVMTMMIKAVLVALMKLLLEDFAQFFFLQTLFVPCCHKHDCTIDLDCGIDDDDDQENDDDVGENDCDHHHTSGLNGQSSL